FSLGNNFLLRCLGLRYRLGLGRLGLHYCLVFLRGFGAFLGVFPRLLRRILLRLHVRFTLLHQLVLCRRLGLRLQPCIGRGLQGSGISRLPRGIFRRPRLGGPFLRFDFGLLGLVQFFRGLRGLLEPAQHFLLPRALVRREVVIAATADNRDRDDRPHNRHYRQFRARRLGKLFLQLRFALCSFGLALGGLGLFPGALFRILLRPRLGYGTRLRLGLGADLGFFLRLFLEFAA